jgi:hypothetical protein
MTTYTEILNQIQTLNITEKNSLFEELKNQLYPPSDIDQFSDEDLEESELEWQNYISGKDKGKSLEEIELELLGGELE